MFNNKTYIIASLFLIIGCSGSNTSHNSLNQLDINSVPINLQYWNQINKFNVIDGYVEGANLYVDWNFNNMQDEGEISAYWTGVTESFEVCVEWNTDDDACLNTVTVDPPDNYYWFVDELIIPDANTLNALGLTRDEWLAEAFPDLNGSVDFVNTGISEYTRDCFNNALKIAEVPIGAFDSIRGSVISPYTLYYNFGFGTESLQFENITPFTTILMQGIESADVPEEVSSACSAQWWDEVNPFINKIGSLIDIIETQLGISSNFFYDDFIASGDEVKRLQAERIVDHLSGVFDIREVVSTNNNLKATHNRVDNETLLEILANPDFSDLTFDLLVEEEEDNGWRKRIHYNDLTVNDDGQLLLNNSPINISYENISLASSLHSIQDVYSVFQDELNFEFIDSTAIFYNNNQERETQVKKSITYLQQGFTNEISNDMYVYRQSSDSIRFIIAINNQSNNLIPYDIDVIVDAVDITSANDIFNIVNTLPLNWPSIKTLESYIMQDDLLQLEKSVDDKSINFDYSTLVTECRVSDIESGALIENAFGETAYDLCSSYYD
ncbi:hypothetical protein N9Y21_04795 [Gammaproteobacteria bacterium]|nr:hypothetical protein [Gammaproteobacteria bacterium]